MGSKSDLPVMEGCTAELERLGVPYELVVASAHRNPAQVHEWAETAADRGIKAVSYTHLITRRPRPAPPTRTTCSPRSRASWRVSRII